MPGPGTYNNEKFMNSVKSNKSIPFGFENRLQEERSSRLTVPGPGSYNKSQRLDRRGGSMGHEDRLAPSKSSSISVPGPGSYKQRGTLSNLGGSVGEAARFVYS